MNKKDMRYLKTEMTIKTAFLTCVDKLGFEKTTISDICAEGMMSRNTFYIHYEDKYALLASIYRELEKEFLQPSIAEVLKKYHQYDITPALDYYVGIVEKNHELLRILLKCHNAEFEELLCHAIMIEPMRPIARDMDRSLENLSLQLDIAYQFHAIINFMRVWLEHYDSLPTEDVKAELEQLCAGPVKCILKKLLEPSDN